MAIKLLSEKLIGLQTAGYAPEYKCEYLCDTAGDVASLPKCAPSSTAVVISTGDVYIANTSGTWVKFGG